jgi:hypothetical protein
LEVSIVDYASRHPISAHSAQRELDRSKSTAFCLSCSVERRLQISSVMIIFGLLVEALCLAWGGPLAFIVFLGVGGLSLFAGIAFYLISLSRHPHLNKASVKFSI